MDAEEYTQILEHHRRCLEVIEATVDRAPPGWRRDQLIRLRDGLTFQRREELRILARMRRRESGT